MFIHLSAPPRQATWLNYLVDSAWHRARTQTRFTGETVTEEQISKHLSVVIEMCGPLTSNFKSAMLMI